MRWFSRPCQPRNHDRYPGEDGAAAQPQAAGELCRLRHAGERNQPDSRSIRTLAETVKRLEARVSQLEREQDERGGASPDEDRSPRVGTAG